MKVYVYTKHTDSEDYKEQKIQVFAKQADAELALHDDVEDFFESSWDEAVEKYGDDDDNTFKSNWVTFCAGDDTYFWNVQEQNLIGTETAFSAGDVTEEFENNYNSEEELTNAEIKKICDIANGWASEEDISEQLHYNEDYLLDAINQVLDERKN